MPLKEARGGRGGQRQTRKDFLFVSELGHGGINVVKIGLLRLLQSSAFSAQIPDVLSSVFCLNAMKGTNGPIG
jgi:hypothetical protein